MPRPFAAPGTRTHFVGDRPARLQHVRLESNINLARKRLSGTATLTLIARRDLPHGVDLRRRRTGRRGGHRRRARSRVQQVGGGKLRVVLPRKPRPKSSAARWMSRSATRASRAAGSISSGRTPSHPERPLQCWTQGQDDDSRYSWPCMRSPDREIHDQGDLCGARGQLRAVGAAICASGWSLPVITRALALRARVPAAGVSGDAGGRPVRWRSPSRAPRSGIDVFYFVPPGREADARRGFQRTPR